MFETPVWVTFLDRLRRATAADNAVLIFHPPGRNLEEAIHLRSSDAAPDEFDKVFREMSSVQKSPQRPFQSEGRLYASQELFELYDPLDAVFYSNLLRKFGITAIRQVRVQEPTGVDAWLTITRRGADFSADETALLSAILPVLRGVLQIYVAVERERFAASVTAEAVRRLQFGWLTLDSSGNVLDCDNQGELVLSRSGVISRGLTGRLRATPAELERELYRALGHLVDQSHARPRAITLCRDPWLDMLLVPARRKSMSGKVSPAVVAYVHGDSWSSTDRCEQLAELFSLSPREARLALALSRGMTIAEAASDLGLTVGSARIYSKRIYAKTGARGLPDLVRIVMRSVLAIAPEA